MTQNFRRNLPLKGLQRSEKNIQIYFEILIADERNDRIAIVLSDPAIGDRFRVPSEMKNERRRNRMRSDERLGTG